MTKKILFLGFLMAGFANACSPMDYVEKTPIMDFRVIWRIVCAQIIGIII